MSILNPNQLVDEFKKSGEFDRLRRELLAQFKNGDSIGSFMARVDDITRQKLTSDGKLQYMGIDAVHAELMQEMDRYPLVERAVSDVAMLSDPSFAANIRKSVMKILKDDRANSAKQTPRPSSESKAEVQSVNGAVSDGAVDPQSSSTASTVISTNQPTIHIVDTSSGTQNGAEPILDAQPESPPRQAPSPDPAIQANSSYDTPVGLQEHAPTQPSEIQPEVENSRIAPSPSHDMDTDTSPAMDCDEPSLSNGTLVEDLAAEVPVVPLSTEHTTPPPSLTAPAEQLDSSSS